MKRVLLLQLDGRHNLALMRLGFQRWVIGAYDKGIPWTQWAAAKYEPRKLGSRRVSLPLFPDNN